MAKPILKWVGGKTQLLPEIVKRFPKVDRYFEPFFGGGAVFYALEREGKFNTALLSDFNSELIVALISVRDDVEGLIQLLGSYTYDKDTFLRVRAQKPSELTTLERAARMIYLNKTGFNGLYRVNKKGEFNVPFGKYTNPTICDSDNLKSVSQALSKVPVIEAQDFSVLPNIHMAQKGDGVYFDPPYIPLSKSSNFTAYQAGGFNMDDQRRLADLFRELAGRGVYVMLSNSDCDESRALYEGLTIHTVSAKRNINSDASKRGAITEILVCSQPD